VARTRVPCLSVPGSTRSRCRAPWSYVAKSITRSDGNRDELDNEARRFRSAIRWRCILPDGQLNARSRSRFRLAPGEVPRKSKGLITHRTSATPTSPKNRALVGKHKRRKRQIVTDGTCKHANGISRIYEARNWRESLWAGLCPFGTRGAPRAACSFKLMFKYIDTHLCDDSST
jgi:hypothetical protein